MSSRPPITDPADYLQLCRELYIQGAASLESPDVIALVGGVLRLVPLDAQEVRVQRDGGFLGLFDRQRNYVEMEIAAAKAWRRHLAGIKARARKFARIEDAVASYISSMVSPTELAGGGRDDIPFPILRMMVDHGLSSTAPFWMQNIEQQRAKVAYQLGVLTGSATGNIVGGTLSEFIDRDKALAIGGMAATLSPAGAAAIAKGAAAKGLMPTMGTAAPQGGTDRPAISAPKTPKVSSAVAQARGTADRGVTPRLGPAAVYSKPPVLPLRTWPPAPARVPLTEERDERNDGGWTRVPQQPGPKSIPDRVEMIYSAPGAEKLRRSEGTSLALADTFSRAGAGSTLSDDKARRAGAMELATMFKILKRPDLEWLDVVPRTNDLRTPDFRAKYLNNRQLQRIEVVTLTQAKQSHTAPTAGGTVRRGAGERMNLTPSRIVDRMKDKLMPRYGQPSQLAEGGELMVAIPFSDLGKSSKAMSRINKYASQFPLVDRITFLGGGDRAADSSGGIRQVIEYRRVGDTFQKVTRDSNSQVPTSTPKTSAQNKNSGR